MKEEFKVIEGYEGYMISNKGRVIRRPITRIHRSKFGKIYLRNLPEKEMKYIYKENEYVYVKLLNNEGKGKNVPVHRLVAIYFIDNPENKPFVNHIDGNKYNYDINNLEWVTHQENIDHAVRTGLTQRGEKCHKAKLTDELVKEIYYLATQTDMTQKEIAWYIEDEYKIKIDRSVVSNIKRKKKWTHIL